MQDLLTLILQNITTNPDAVQIEEVEEDGRIVFNVTVDPSDMGRVIGKSGKVIQAIRSIMHVAAIRNDARVRVNVVEVEGESSVEEAPVVEEAAPAPATEEVIEADEAPREDSDIDLISGAIDLSEETK